jgi:hypothetical protein
MRTREEKIQALEMIQAGEISVGDLLPPQFYLIIERSNKPGVYECDNNGKTYSPQEFIKFKEGLRPVDKIWLEKRNY